MHLLVGRYAFIKAIGKGGFGAVDEYRDCITNENVAIKTIPSRFVNQESRRLVREIDIMSFLHEAHPHVIGYFSMFVTRCTVATSLTSNSNNHSSSNNGGGGSHDDGGVGSIAALEQTPAALNVGGPLYANMSDDEKLQRHHAELTSSVSQITKGDEFNVHIVMPLMKGDLFYFIRLLTSQSSVQRLGVTDDFLAQVAVVFAFQICFGLDYLHQCAIIHRDMKPDNVLVRLDITNPYMSTALIADMGLARDAQHSDTIYICTRYYRPPEVITSVSRGSTKIDIWSLGCIFFEICTGRTLFNMRTALNDRGEWDGAKASIQLEVILNIIGTPSTADVDRYMPEGNAKLYLRRSAKRPSQLRSLIESQWILHCSGDEKEKWIDLITRCVAFFPEQRPTAQQLCQHQLFRDYNVFYGSNVKQYASTRYSPTFRGPQDADRRENKASVLALVQKALVDTTPPALDEESLSTSEATSVSGSDTTSTTSSTTSSSDEESEEARPELEDEELSSRHRVGATAPSQSISGFMPSTSLSNTRNMRNSIFVDDDDEEAENEVKDGRAALSKDGGDVKPGTIATATAATANSNTAAATSMTLRYSPGNVFAADSTQAHSKKPTALTSLVLGGGVASAPACMQGFSNLGGSGAIPRSSASEASTPIIVETPPMAPVPVVTRAYMSARRRGENSTAFGAGGLPSTQSVIGGSIFNFDFYKSSTRTIGAEEEEEEEEEEDVMGVPCLPQVPQRLTSPINGSTQYSSFKLPHKAASQLQPLPPASVQPLPEQPLNQRASEGGASGGNDRKHAKYYSSRGAGVPQACATVLQSGGKDDEEYDYFGDSDYLTSHPTRNGSVRLQQGLPSRRGSHGVLKAGKAVSPPTYLYDFPAPVPAEPSRAPVAFPSLIHNDLRDRYMAYQNTPQGVQEATSSVLEELSGCTHDARRSSELRELLHYFTSLK